MKTWRTLVVAAMALLTTGPAIAQQTTTNEPEACIRLGQVTGRVEAVSTLEPISEQEFRQVAKGSDKLDIQSGNVDYVKIMEASGKVPPTFYKATMHEDKQAEFLKWYINGGNGELASAIYACTDAYDKQVRESSDPRQQAALQHKSVAAWAYLISADAIATNVLVHKFNALVRSYNALVADANAYHNAVIRSLNFNFVPPQPITCTADTFMYGTDTTRNATTTIRCE